MGPHPEQYEFNPQPSTMFPLLGINSNNFHKSFTYIDMCKYFCYILLKTGAGLAQAV
jgi:hypothetical protein